MGLQDGPPSSPSARKLAASLGIDLSTVTGTGPDGKITRSDVEAAGGGKSPASPPPQVSADTQHGATNDAQIAASPMARRIAEDKGIDLATIKGTGPNGKIVKADVEDLEPGASPAIMEKPSAGAAGPDVGQPPEVSEATSQVVPLNNVRKTIARRLTEAKQKIPHIYLTLDIRLDALLDLRREINATASVSGQKVSVNDMLIKALAKGLQKVPSCNVSFQGDTLVRYSRQDISVAVAAPSGLITPIVRDAANKGLGSLSAEMKQLVEKAHNGKLQPHEFQGGTASLSNLGMFGIKQFEAVINPPQAMILAVGAAELRPCMDGGEIVPGMILSATGSFDHRAIDGADGAQLMQCVKDLCENPMSLFA